MANQPPFAEYPRPDDRPRVGRLPGARIEAIGEAWDLVFKDLGHWVAATIVYFVIVWALSIPISLLMQPYMPRRPEDFAQALPALGLQFLLNLIPYSVSSVLLVGMISMGVKKARGEYIDVGMIFEPFRSFGKIFGTTLLYWLVASAASLACVLPFFYFAPVLVLMPVVAYQKGLGPVEALSLTFYTCRRYWAGLLGLCIVLWFVSFVGILVCCVGVLVAWPLVCVTLGIHYLGFFEPEPLAPPTTI